MPLVVCQGAMAMCPLGTAPSTLTVTSQQSYTIGGMLVATIQDCNPMVNLPPFGTCNTLTAAAQGVPTMCALAPVGMWTPGSTLQKINNIPVLTQACTLACGIGGVITITNPNNVVVQTL
jgi:hypothetical protein